MNKQRFLKIMSWYLIISMIFQILPLNVIAVAMAKDNVTKIPVTVLSDDEWPVGKSEGESPAQFSEVRSGEIGGVPAYTVSFHSDSGTSSVTVEAGTGLQSVPEAPARADFIFFGWNTAQDGSGEFYTLSTPVNASTDLYAVYSRTAAHITYLAGAHGSVDRAEETVQLADGIGALGVTATADADARFLNWTDENGAVVSEDPFFVPTVGVTGTGMTREPGDPYSGVITEAVDAVYTANFVYMPAQTFEAETDTFTVRVAAPAGAFPEGTEINAADVSSDVAMQIAESYYGENVNIADAVAVDLSFSHNGEEVQPYGGRKVSVSLNVTHDFGNGDLALLHEEHDGTITEVGSTEGSGEAPALPGASTMDLRKAPAARSFSTVEFNFAAGSFSVYVVVKTGSDARVKVRFMNGETEVASIYVKESDTTSSDYATVLYDPGVGDVPSGQAFYGWTTNSQYTADEAADAMSIGGVRDAVAELDWGNVVDADAERGTVLTYYAALCEAYHVTYIDDLGAALGAHAVLHPSWKTDDAEGYTVNMAYTPEDINHNFEGWLVDSGGGNIVGHSDPATVYTNEQVISITGDVTFSVDAPEGHWLVFDENGKGGTYNAPQFVKSGEATVQPRDPSDMIRAGYTFAALLEPGISGWYTDAACTPGNEFTFGGEISEMTTIYARWISNETALYTVLIWKQNVAGDGYDFEESIPLSGNVGATITSVTAQGTGNGRYARVDGVNKRYEGFHLDTYDTNVIIVTEGSSVVNVYYARNKITLNFYTYGYTYTVSEGDHDNNPAKYGVVDGNYQRVYWRNGSFRTEDRNNAPVYDGTVYTRSGSQSWSLYQTMTGLYASTLADNGYSWPTEYDWYSTYGWDGSTGGTRTTFMDAFLPPSGDTENFYARATQTGNSAVEFYKQNESLDGYVVANRVTTSGTNVTFSISDKYQGFKADHYEVNGRTTQLGEKDSNGYYATGVQYGGTTLRIYFDRLVYSLVFMDGAYVDGNGNPITSETGQGELKEVARIAYGADISGYNEGGSDYYEPEYSGYVFEGWFLDDNCTQPVTFDTMPIDGLTVYAKWRQVQYRVFLHPNAGTDPTLDWGSDSQAMNFRISLGSKASVPTGRRTGYEFVGWFLDEGFSRPFNANAFVLNESTVTSGYNKDTDFTDPMDRWGNGATTNADVNRPWITKKLDLYAQWRTVVEGATGIGIVYVQPDGTVISSDSNLYKDQAKARSAAAVTPPEGQVFSHWVVQKWNGTEYEDTDVNVKPGETFTVNMSDAKREDAEGSTPEKPRYTYTIQLRAEYIKPEEKTPTHITWYGNGGTTASGETEVTDKADGTLQINEAVDIRPANTFTWEGHTFLGWAKEADATEPWLLWTGVGFTYDDGKTAVQVAADENKPYDDLYAIWSTEVTAVITGSLAEKTYTGSEQSNTGYTVTYYVGGEEAGTLPDGVTFTLTPAAPAAKGTDVGTYEVQLSGTLESTDPLYVVPEGAVTYDETYEGKVTLKIIPAELTVTIVGNTDTKTYTGSEQSVTGYTITIPEGAKLTEAEITGPAQAEAIAKGTDVDGGTNSDKTYPMGLTAEDFSTTNKNYTVTFEVTDGWLKITPAELTVTIEGNTDTKVYNGEEQSVTGYTITIPEGAKLTEAEITGPAQADAIAKGTDVDGGSNPDKTYPMGLTEDQFGTTNKNYTVTFDVTDGWLKITKRSIILTSATDSKVYDGTALTNNTVTVSGDGFAEGDGAAYNVTGSQTLVGSSENTFTYTLNDGTLAANYDIQTVFGTLTVTDGTPDEPVKDDLVVTKTAEAKTYHVGDTVTFTVKATNIYDEARTITLTEIEGVTLEQSTFENVEPGATVETTATYTITAADAAAGSFTNTVTAKVGELEKKAEATVTTETIAITITADSASKVYDGQPLTKDSWSQTAGTLAEGDTIQSVTVTGSQTLVGSSSNVPSAAKIVNAAGTDVTAGYAITYANGTLTVTDGTNPDDPEPVKDDLVVTKTAEAKTYHVGDTVTFTVKATNIYEEARTITLTEIAGVTLAQNTFENVEPGATVTTTATYTITAADVVAGEFTNTVTAAIGELEKTATATVETETLAIEITAASDEKVYDGTALTNSGYEKTSGELAEDNKIDSVTVTGSQTSVGSSDNVASDAKIVDANGADVTAGYTITYVNGTLTVTKAKLTITANPQTYKYNGQIQGEGDTAYEDPAQIAEKVTVTGLQGDDTVTSVILDGQKKDAGIYEGEIVPSNAAIGDATGNYEITYVNGTLTIEKRSVVLTSATDSKTYDGEPLTNDEVTVSGDGFIEGEGASYDVTGSQTLVGSSENTFTYTLNEGTSADNYDITVVFGTLTVTDGTNPGEDPVDPELVVTKTADDKTYKLGETVTFTVTAANIYDEPMTITFEEIEGVTLEQSTFENVPAGESVETTAAYVITEADILAGSFTNTVKAKLGNIEKEAEATVTTEDPNGHLTIVKTATSTPANGETYALGETISYQIVVTNDGNLTITDITVTDDLTGDEWTVASLAPGESETFTASYVVTEADILAGEVLNVATGTGKSPDPENPDVPVDPGEDPEPTDPKNGHLTIVKTATSTPANGETYALGETISYQIVVTNDGNLTITDITVTDELTGDEWTIASLAPGESETFTASYVVTEADILAGEVLNVATGTGKSPDPENPDVPVDPGEDPEPTDPKNGHLTIVKTATSEPADGIAYILGETIEYQIVVTNDGNLTITDITVTDELTGDEWTIASLAPGESETFTTSYVVTQADVDAGQVLNVATATGTSPDPEKPEPDVEPGVDPEPTDEINVTLTIHYVTYGVEGDWSTYVRTYKKGSEYNVASPYREGYTVDIERVQGTITEDTEVTVTYYPRDYTLTIHYRYYYGETAAPDYKAVLKTGEAYRVTSPYLPGWTADRPLVEGVMPGRNVEITVWYVRDYVPPVDPETPETDPSLIVTMLTIDEYGAPLGLGDISVNVGIAIE